MFSPALMRLLNRLSNDAVPDMSEGGDDAECVAEAVFTMLDFHPEKAELRSLVAEHGYKAVLKAAATVVVTA